LTALHDRVAVRVAERRREIARVEDERVAGAQDLLGHLVDGRDERVLQHLERDRVERVGAGLLRRHEPLPTWIRMFSHSSTSASRPGGTSVVESSWSMTAGPSILVPAASSSRRKTGVSTGSSASSKRTQRVLSGREGAPPFAWCRRSSAFCVTPVARIWSR